MATASGLTHRAFGSRQFTGHDWQDFLRDHNLISSMSRRGNCRDNAMAESFFATLECELIDGRSWQTKTEARLALFTCIEGWHNPKRRHGTARPVSPVEFERRHSHPLESV